MSILIRLTTSANTASTFNGAIIRTGTESHRLAHTKAQAERAQVI
ncbi:hypothetical protein [Streptomyces sp. NPDC088801]